MPKFHHVEAFTSKIYDTVGNPAGVVILEKLLPKKVMSKIAKSFRMPVSSFIERTDQPDQFTLRYYELGGRDCRICGHATVAAAEFLVKDNPQLRGKKITFLLDPFFYHGKQEYLETWYDNEGFISLTMPESELEDKSKNSELKAAIARSLKIDVQEIGDVEYSRNIGDLVVEILSAETLEAMVPDFDYMRDMANGVSHNGLFEHEGLMCTAKSNQKEWDIKERVFLPKTGVNEDIACGSANCSIVPFWYRRGMNTASKTYNSVFPLPTVPGRLGGVQKIIFYPEIKRIKIMAQGRYVKASEIPAELLK